MCSCIAGYEFDEGDFTCNGEYIVKNSAKVDAIVFCMSCFINAVSCIAIDCVRMLLLKSAYSLTTFAV